MSEACVIVHKILARVAQDGEEDADVVKKIYEEAQDFSLEVSAGTEDGNDGENDMLMQKGRT